ncbi:MAG: hypothetical protein IPJ20_03655 [Flammeovirgaceae bacterium]|nr:hypothetical protein [Flammeovirgaceae bacterium]
MDNPDIYGNTFELLTFKEALEVRPAILSDYRIITIGVSQDEVKEIIERNAYIRPAKGTWNDDIEAHTLTSIIALRKAMEKFPIKHAVSFHSSIARAKSFEESQNRITEVISDFNPIDTFHVTGATPTSERSKIIEAFSASPKALITNVRCLIEGVDIRNIDCILFADPKQNTIDIVQAVGRALRVLKGKKYGYVVIPVLAEEIEGEQVINNESYKHLIQTIGALATNDERIVEYFKLKNEKGLSKRKHSEHNELVEIYGERIDLEDLKNAVELRVWKRIAKLRWRPFNEAREFVHSLGFKNWAQWRNFCNSGNRPDDIPSNPNLIYKDHGWKGNSDWLTGTIGHHYRDYKPFKEARAFVHSLEFKRLAEWRAYLKSGHKLADIPFKPERLYSGKGWKGYGDWLGSGNISNLNRKFRPFSEARKFAQSLNFINRSEWEHFL